MAADRSGSSSLALVDHERTPRIVSDGTLLDALGGGGESPAARERVREARLLAFGLYLEAVSRLEVQGGATPLWEVEIPLREKGLRQLTGQKAGEFRQGLEALERIEAIEIRRRGGQRWVVLAEAFCEPLPAASTIDWDLVAHRLGGQKPALIVLRSLLELLPLDGSYRAITSEELAAHAGYRASMERQGRQELEAAELVFAKHRPGRPIRLRLAPYLFRDRPTADPAAPGPEGPADESAPANEAPPGRVADDGALATAHDRPRRPPTRDAPSPTDRPILLAGGQPLHVHADRALHVELGPDDTLHLRIEGSEARFPI